MNNDFNNITQEIAINFMNEFSEYDRMHLTNSFSHSDEPIFFRDEFFRVEVESNYSITPDTAFLFSYDFANRKFEEGSDASINTVTTGIRQDITRKIYFDGKAGLSFIDSFNDESLIRPVLEAAFSYEVDTFTLARLSFRKKTDTNPYIRVLIC